MCSIPGILSSSTKMPFPLTSRFSSLRRIGWPTHFTAPSSAPFAPDRFLGPRLDFFFVFAIAFAAIRISCPKPAPSAARQSVSAHSFCPEARAARRPAKSPAPARSTAPPTSLSYAHPAIPPAETLPESSLSLPEPRPCLHKLHASAAVRSPASSSLPQLPECARCPHSASPENSWDPQSPFPENPAVAGKIVLDLQESRKLPRAFSSR